MGHRAAVLVREYQRGAGHAGGSRSWTPTGGSAQADSKAYVGRIQLEAAAEVRRGCERLRSTRASPGLDRRLPRQLALRRWQPNTTGSSRLERTITMVPFITCSVRVNGTFSPRCVPTSGDVRPRWRSEGEAVVAQVARRSTLARVVDRVFFSSREISNSHRGIRIIVCSFRARNHIQSQSKNYSRAK